MEIEDLEDELDALTTSVPQQHKPKPRQAPAQPNGWSMSGPSASQPSKPATSLFGNASKPMENDEVSGLRPFSPGEDNTKPFNPLPMGNSAPGPYNSSTYSAPAPETDKAMDLLNKIEARVDQQKGRTSAASRSQRANPASASSSGVRRPQAVGATQGAYDAQGAAPPVLNEVKLDFSKRRWLQTVLGGPRCLFQNSRPRASLIVLQWLIWALPILIGLPLSILTCPISGAQCDGLKSPVGSLIAGATVAIVHLILQVLRSRFREQVGIEGSGQNGGKGGLAALSEEDDFEDVDVFSARGWGFLMPYRGWMALPHSVFLGALVGVSVHFLSPDFVKASMGGGSEGEAAAIYGVCWLVVGLAAYSINGHPPPEPNSYYSDDAHRPLGPCSRGLHCIIIMMPSVIDSQFVNIPSLILLATLPLLWAFGSLPSAEVLLEWAGEQGLMYLHGASAQATIQRLAVSLCLTWIGIGVGYLLESEASLWLALAASGAFGFILSHDLSPLAPKPGGLSTYGSGGLVQWASGSPEAAFKVLMLIALIALPIALESMEKDKAGLIQVQGLGTTEQTIRPLLDYVLMAGMVLTAVTSHLQRPYLFGLWANPIRKTLAAGKGVKDLGAIGWLKWLFWISLWLGRLGVIGYVYCFSLQNNSGLPIAYSSKAEIVWHQITISRALRRVWQCPGGAAMEAGLAVLVNLVLGDSCTHQYCTRLQPCDQFLIAGFVLARASELWDKVAFGSVLASTSWTDTKQRAKYAGTTLCVLATTFPLSLGILIASVLLSAPLLPLLGVPLFLIGFPRSRRHWPASEGTESSALDAAYYRLMAPQVAHQVVQACEAGAFGPCVIGGEHFLVRKDAFLLMVQVMERGYGYSIVNIKGMELQETSCHHVEAGAIETILDSALGDCTESAKPPALPGMNPYSWHCLDPVLKIKLQTYTLGDNQLTGIIDNPELKSGIPKTLTHSLLWVLRSEKLKASGVPPSWFEFKEFNAWGTSITSPAAKERYPHKFADLINLYKAESAAPQVRETANVQPQPPAQVVVNQPVASPTKPAVGIPSNTIVGVAPSQSPQKVQIGAAPIEAKPITIGNALPTASQPSSAPAPSAEPLASQTPAPQPRAPPKGGEDLDVDDLLEEDIDDLLEEMVAGAKFGNDGTADASNDSDSDQGGVKTEAELICATVSPVAPQSHSVVAKHFGVDDADNLLDELEDLAGSSATKPDTPQKPITSAPQSASVLAAQPPESSATNGLGGSAVAGTMALDVEQCNKWLAACWGIVEEWGHVSSKDGPDHSVLVYSGDLPSSSESQWIQSRLGLKEIIVKAFRYAFKFQYDMMLYGLDDTDEGMKEAFEEYDKDWFFGPENSLGWAKGVESGTKNLMAIWKEKGDCRSRVATLVDSSYQVARLNSEAVRGLWASLGMELYYFTNDDDERYSIQANTNLLRNLMIQGAAPPLGYPLFISPVTCGHAN